MEEPGVPPTKVDILLYPGLGKHAEIGRLVSALRERTVLRRSVGMRHRLSILGLWTVTGGPIA